MNKLSGEIPKEISNLEYLAYLWVINIIKLFRMINNYFKN